MQDLNIHLFVNPSCELVAIDKTSYHNLRYNDGDYLDDLSDHISIEFLSDVDGIIDRNTINFDEFIGNREYYLDGNTSVFHFPKDGTFTYYKMLVPKIDHLHKEDDIYKTKDQMFYYDSKFYYSDQDFYGDNITSDYIVSMCKELSIEDL